MRKVHRVAGRRARQRPHERVLALGDTDEALAAAFAVAMGLGVGNWHVRLVKRGRHKTSVNDFEKYYFRMGPRPDRLPFVFWFLHGRNGFFGQEYRLFGERLASSMMYPTEFTESLLGLGVREAAARLVLDNDVYHILDEGGYCSSHPLRGRIARTEEARSLLQP